MQCWAQPKPQHTSTFDTDYETERTVWACCFLPAKTHSVLSCCVSFTHPLEFFNFFLPYYHNAQILSPSLALAWPRWVVGREGSIYTVSELELRGRQISLSEEVGVVSLLQKHFKQGICHISSGKPTNIQTYTLQTVSIAEEMSAMITRCLFCLMEPQLHVV